MRCSFRAELWLYAGEAPWTFVTLPADVADEIESLRRSSRRSFGSVPVTVTIGATTWKTSVFPDKKAGSYLLPVKKAVRSAEQLHEGDVVDVTLDLPDRV